MATTQELEYLVKVNDRDLNELKGRVREVNKAIGDETTTHANRGSAAFGKLGHAAGLAALGLAGAGVASLAGAAKIGWDEFNQGAKVAAQTNAVLASTGGAAGVTAGQVSGLAGALMRKSGMDDEAIASGENLLLTFTNIRNEAGKGNDIFTQTTKTMADMSVALGQDTKSSAIQLGKALNDPIKGVTALQRVGVSFTEAQKEQIKTLVESGNAMGAQKLILGELNKEFGGSAEAAGKTLPGQLNVLKETFRNLSGEAVGAMIPALTGILKGFVDNLPAIEAFVGGLVNKAQPVLRAIIAVIRDNVLPILAELKTIFVNAVQAIASKLEQNKPALTEIWTNLRTLITAVAKVLDATLIPVLKFTLEKVLPTAIGIALPIMAKLSEGFRVIAAVVSAGADAVNAVRGALAAVGTFVGGAWGKVKAALTAPIEAAQGIFSAFASVVRSIRDALRELIGAASDALGAIGKVAGAASGIKGALGHIPGFADGVTGFAGGLAVVGERGPELVRLPSGSDVVPNHKVGATLAAVAAKSAGAAATAAGLFAGATFIVRDDLDAHAIGAAVASRLATLAPA